MLQYFEKLSDPTGGWERVSSLLRTHSEPSLTVTVTGALGHPSVRAGVSLFTDLPGADRTMTVESARHVFRGPVHTMDLELRKGE